MQEAGPGPWVPLWVAVRMYVPKVGSTYVNGRRYV